MPLIAEDILYAQNELQLLQEQVAKIGLQILFKKIVTDIKTAPDELNIDSNKISQVNWILNFCEWIIQWWMMVNKIN